MAETPSEQMRVRDGDGRELTAITVVPEQERTAPGSATIGMSTLRHLKGNDHPGELARLLHGWHGAVTTTQGEPRYSLLGTLGSGAQGVVYRLIDRDCRREIAFKTVRSREADPNDLSRFVHEAQITAQLEHPGIVPVHDFGVLADGTVYYTMKCIEGSHLGTWMQDRRGRADQRFDLLNLLLRVCEAVGFAHSRGVIHRDLKPRNIMVGRYGEVLVMDWGLAKIIGAGEETTVSSLRSDLGDDEDIHRTMVGFAVGTPAYMSPEAARGELDRVDARSDVYSLGVILYEMVIGESPYIRGNVRNTIDQVAQARIRPFAEAGLGEGGRQLGAILRKALAGSQDERYQSVDDLARDLRAWLAGQSVSAYREGWSEHLWRRLREHRRPVLAALTAGLVVGLGVGVWRYLVHLREVEDLRTWHQEAAAALRDGDGDLARERYERILTRSPGDAMALEGRLQSKQVIEARIAAQAEAERRDEARILRVRADTARERGDAATAAEDYLRFLGLEPGNDEVAAAYRDTVAVLAAQAEDQRRAALDEARQRQAADLLRRAEEARDGGRLQEALSLAEASLHLVPGETARVLLVDLDRDLAAATTAAAERRRRQEGDAIRDGVNVTLAEGDAEEAGRLLERLHGIDPRHPDLDDLRDRHRALAVAQRNARADALVAEARKNLGEVDDLALAIAETTAEVRLQETALVVRGDAAARVPLRIAEARLESLTRTRASVLARALETLHRAHVLAPEHRPVSDALADYFVGRMLEFDRQGDRARAEAAAAEAKVYDDGRHGRVLAGLVRVELAADQAPCRLHPLVLGPDRCDQAADTAWDLAAGEGRDLPAGRYLLIDGQGRHRALRFAAGAQVELRPDPLPEVPAGTVAIPEGTVYAADGRALQRVEAFALGRTEVTCGEWLDFVNDPDVRRRIDAAWAEGEIILVPRLGLAATEPLWRSRGILGRRGGTFLLELSDGTPIAADLPVSQISFEDALAYVAWRNREGGTWRLPTSVEWAYAVQGGDGRAHPWGEKFDPGLCHGGIAAQVERAWRNLMPVTSFPGDRSVQGVHDLAGSLSEFVIDEGLAPGFATVAGGNRADRQGERFTAWSRREILRRLPSDNCGLRLACDLPDR